jgi:hypothetical protein
MGMAHLSISHSQTHTVTVGGGERIKRKRRLKKEEAEFMGLSEESIQPCPVNEPNSNEACFAATSNPNQIPIPISNTVKYPTRTRNLIDRFFFGK